VNAAGGSAANAERPLNPQADADLVGAPGLSANANALTEDGGDGNDILIGGDGNDVIEGGPGNDLMFGGAGDDVFTWDPGDGSDLIEGQGGHDTMQFTGADLDEHIDISANGHRVRFFRDIGNIT